LGWKDLAKFQAEVKCEGVASHLTSRFDFMSESSTGGEPMLGSPSSVRCRAMTNSSSNHSNNLEILTDQVGRLTEGLTEFRLSMEQSSAEFRADLANFRAETEYSSAEFRVEMSEFRKDMADLKATVQRQSETTDRLVRIVETLIQRQNP
jgi:predicted RNase H-like nuclease (RuvC/YqgF family)